MEQKKRKAVPKKKKEKKNIRQKRKPHMNWDQIETNWEQFKDKVKEKWKKLSDDKQAFSIPYFLPW